MVLLQHLYRDGEFCFRCLCTTFNFVTGTYLVTRMFLSGGRHGFLVVRFLLCGFPRHSAFSRFTATVLSCFQRLEGGSSSIRVSGEVKQRINLCLLSRRRQAIGSGPHVARHCVSVVLQRHRRSFSKVTGTVSTTQWRQLDLLSSRKNPLTSERCPSLVPESSVGK